MLITATYLYKRMQDSGSDGAPDYYAYHFTDVTDEAGKKYGDKWMKETKLLQQVPFLPGKSYNITLSYNFFSMDAARLPYPKEVTWGNERVYMKGNNQIIYDNGKGDELNHSERSDKGSEISNYEKGAWNKFSNGKLTEDLLLKMNRKGWFFKVEYIDPQDKRKSGGTSSGLTRTGNENYALIKMETQEELNRAIDNVKRYYVKPEIEKHFRITAELLPPKKRKK